FVAVNLAVSMATQAFLKRPPGPGRLPPAVLDSLSGMGATLAGMANLAAGASQIVMAFFTILLIARVVFRKNWAAIATVVLFFGTLYYFLGASTDGPVAAAISTGVGVAAFAVVALRFGFLAALTAGFLMQIIGIVPLTTDLSAWYSSRTFLVLAPFSGLLVFGFLTALGGRSLFKDPIGEG